MQVTLDDRFDVVLINGRILFTYPVRIRDIFIGSNDRMLVCGSDAGVGHNGGQEQGMCTTAIRTLNTANMQKQGLIRKEDTTVVVSMDRQTG